MPSRLISSLDGFARSPLPVFVLVGIAGSMDALVMVHSKDLLAVYMTGNSTKLAQSLIHGAFDKARPLACVIATFLFATTVTAWLGARVPSWRAALALGITSLMLACAIPFTGDKYSPLATCFIAAAMGAMNQARADQPGVTFITGALVGVGRQLADGRLAEAALGLLRWAALIVGAAIGALLDLHFASDALAIMAIFALACALLTTLYDSAMATQRAQAGSVH